MDECKPVPSNAKRINKKTEDPNKHVIVGDKKHKKFEDKLDEALRTNK